MNHEMWLDYIMSLSEYLNVKQPNNPDKLIEALSDVMHFDQFKKCCKWLKYNHSYRSYTMLRDFMEAKNATLITRIKVSQWRIDAAKKLRMPLSQLPEHAFDLTDEQRDILNLVPRDFKIRFESNAINNKYARKIVRKQKIEIKPEMEELPF